jgi:hypothetical protein
MALFKQLRGNRATLDSQPLTDGYAYFCVDDGTFHIDFKDTDGVLKRKQINAKDAETLTGLSLDEIINQVQSNIDLSNYYTKTEIDNLELITVNDIDIICGVVSIILFTINSTTYQAEEGMTWGEWVESDYNTGGFYLSAYDANNILSTYGTYIKFNNNDVIRSDIIIENQAYLYDENSFVPDEW